MIIYYFFIHVVVIPKIFVTLATPKILSLEKTQIKFGFLLAYSYLCTRFYYRKP